MQLVYLHNPQCSKSRQGLAWLQEQGHEPQVRLYLKEPLSLDELRILKRKLGQPVAQWVRFNEAEAEGLSRTAPDMELLAAIADHPRLLERPILISEEGAVVGRPTEALGRLLNA